MADAIPAVDRLLDLAGETRPDIRREQLHGAILNARTVGWSWRWVMVEVVRLLADPDGEPRDLNNAVADPLKSGRKANR